VLLKPVPIGTLVGTRNACTQSTCTQKGVPMPKLATPLTDNQIRHAKAKAKEYSLSHGQGLGVRVRTNGTKEWIFRYKRPFTGVRTAIKLGDYPDLTILDAQDSRTDCLNLLAKDIDPLEARTTKNREETDRQAHTLELVAGKWFEVKKTKITEDFAKDVWRSLESHIFPTLGRNPISRIDAPTVIEAINPVAARGNLETVKRLCQRLNEIMTFAVNSGVIQHNPLSGIREGFAKPVKKHNPTLEPEQLPLLMSTLNYASIHLTTRVMIEWQLHTMVRPMESAGTRWEEINLNDSTWTIPKERMKKKREHIVPLSPQALALLEVMRPISGHKEYVFPSQRDPLRHANEQSPNVALKRMGFKDILTAHGIRALASTTLNEEGFDYDIIEMSLAHIDPNETRRSYNHAKYLPRRRVMMDWWSNRIEEAATGNMSIAASVRGLLAVK
jgi:integrase